MTTQTTPAGKVTTGAGNDRGQRLNPSLPAAPDTSLTARCAACGTVTVDEALAARLHVELEDLRAIVDLEVDRALFGITPSKYLQRVGELEAARRKLPDDDYPPRRQPWVPERLDRATWRDSATDTRFFTRGGVFHG